MLNYYFKLTIKSISVIFDYKRNLSCSIDSIPLHRYLGQDMRFWYLTFYLIATPFNTFANRVDPDHAALVRAA